MFSARHPGLVCALSLTLAACGKAPADRPARRPPTTTKAATTKAATTATAPRPSSTVATVATGPVALRGASARVAWRVTVAVDNAAAQVQATTLTPVVQAIVVETERQLDPARADGDLGRFNKTTSRRPQPVSGPALAVVEAGLALGRQTSGAFDITAGPLRAAWSDLASPPDGATLQIARARTGLQRVLPEKGMLKKDVVDLEIDASAIIDSVAVDGIAAALRERGFSAFAIEVGGAALAVGRGADGPWSVGLPVGAAPPVMPLDSASGGGRAMALAVAPPPPGTIDPRSGRPVAHDLERCVVIGEDVVVVDGLAEACLVLGSDGLLQTLRAFPGVEAGWLRRDGSSASTPGFPSTGLPSKG